MRNHVHLVLETTENGGSLSEIMKLRDLQKTKNMLQTNVLIYKNADYHDFQIIGRLIRIKINLAWSDIKYEPTQFAISANF